MNNKKIGLKNFGIYAIFNIILEFVLPLVGTIIAMLLTVGVMSLFIEKGSSITINSEIMNVFLYLWFAMTVMTEFLTTKITLKITKSNHLISPFLLGFIIAKSLIYTLFLFADNPLSKTSDYNATLILLMIVLIVKAISYIITKRFILKEKIANQKKFIIVATIYILSIFVIFNLKYPTSLNEYFSFDTNQFSSNELKKYLVDEYNNNYKNNCGNNYGKNITYNHKFSEDELGCFTELNFNIKFTTNDIEKFKNLTSLKIENIDFDDTISLNNCKYLQNIEIINSNFNELNITEVTNLVLDADKVNIQKINVLGSSTSILGNSIKLNINEGTINELTINHNMETAWLYLDFNKTEINSLNISNKSTSPTIRAEDSTINNLLFKNDSSIMLQYYPTLNIKNVKNIEFSNFKDVPKMLAKSDITFNTLKYNDKEIYLANNEYLNLKENEITLNNGNYLNNIKVKNLTINKNDNTIEIYDNNELLFIVK